MAQLTTAEAKAGLQQWIRTHDAHVRVAVQLLIEHDHWLRSRTFLDVAVSRFSDGGPAVGINWRAARDAFDKGEFDRSSTTELAILDLAITIAQDRFRWNIMGPATSRMVATAVGHALGLDKHAGKRLS